MQTLGICPESIEHAEELCESVLDNYHLDYDEWKESVETNYLNSIQLGEDSFTNYLVTIMFESLKSLFRKEYPALETDMFINGWDSHFYIKNDETLKMLLDADIDVETVKKIINHNLQDNLGLNDDKLVELAKHKAVIEDLIKVYNNNNDIVIYESAEELGEDNKDNGCREDDDTDESFGYFLIQSYKDGHSNTLYFQFNDGQIIAAPLE